MFLRKNVVSFSPRSSSSYATEQKFYCKYGKMRITDCGGFLIRKYTDVPSTVPTVSRRIVRVIFKTVLYR